MLAFDGAKMRVTGMTSNSTFVEVTTVVIRLTSDWAWNLATASLRGILQPMLASIS